MGKFKPEMYCQSIFTINYNLLKEKNIKVLIFDLDNTIINAYSSMPDDDVVKLFAELRQEFQVFIASNNKKGRVRSIGKYLGVHAFYTVFKPTIRIKKLLLRKVQVNMQEVAIIGDQIITDILMGNRLHMYTILVDPLGNKDLKITWLNRFVEKRIMKKINLFRGNYYE